MMGPYSEFLQNRRRQVIQKLLDHNPQLDEVTRAMWTRHLNNIACSEEEYNARVRDVYGNFFKRYTKEWLT